MASDEEKEKRASANMEAMRESVRILGDRLATSERRITVVERKSEKHVDALRQGSESDAKLASDQASMATAIVETHKIAKKALEATARIERGNASLQTETEEQTTLLKKRPTSQIVVMVVNLVIGLVYLALEIMKQLPPH
jgi:hypothetical protein